MHNSPKPKVLISGGGTGGHVFPAIAIANKLKEWDKETDILFVGAKGKLEMEKVPEAGYPIEGLWISGLQRNFSLSNLAFPFKLLSSLTKANRILNRFKPDVVVGLGGYASGAVLHRANKRGIPTLIQEQNSYAGLTNKLLANRTTRICVAYKNMERFFPKDRIVMTGNPVRADILNISSSKEEALQHFKLEQGKKTLLVMGGSGGALSINDNILASLDRYAEKDIQILWQTGKTYYDSVKNKVNGRKMLNVVDFISRMDLAYQAADLVVSRAGALAISELCVVGKPAILVPSPNVAEDHQTRNALALVDQNAARMVKDLDAGRFLESEVLALMANVAVREEMALKIKQLAVPDAADRIATEVLKLVKQEDAA